MRSTQENILVLRRLGYSQVRIAEELGISQPMVSRWESGEVPNAADVALKLARLVESASGDTAGCCSAVSTVNPKNQPNQEFVIPLQPIGDENGTFLCIAPPIAIGATEKREAERREIKVQETVLHQRCGNERRGES